MGFSRWLVPSLGFIVQFTVLAGTPLLCIEEVLAGVEDSHVHVFVADVVKPFDTVDMGVSDRVL